MNKKSLCLFLIFMVACFGFLSCGESHKSTIEKPLADTAFKAEITGVDPVLRLKPSERAFYKVTVKNISKEIWPAKGMNDGKFQINFGNHWLDKKGATVINDQTRMPLPRDVKPGESIQYSIAVEAPSKPGEYKLVFDMVQELVAWFAWKGSPVLSYDVAVGP